MGETVGWSEICVLLALDCMFVFEKERSSDSGAVCTARLRRILICSGERGKTREYRVELLHSVLSHCPRPGLVWLACSFIPTHTHTHTPLAPDPPPHCAAMTPCLGSEGDFCKYLCHFE